MRTTTQSRIKESAFELNFSGEPNTERSTMLKLKKKLFYSKNGKITIFREGGSSDHPTKPKKSKAVTNNLFLSSNEKTKKNLTSYILNYKQQSWGTKYTVSFSDNKIFHSKRISKPIESIEREPTNRGTGPRGPYGRFSRKETKLKRQPPLTPERCQLQEESAVISPEAPSCKRTGTFGRER